MENDPSLPYSRVAAFVRQHTHDVRNHLNGLDLEAALLADIVTDRDATESVKRLRSQIREAAAGLRTLSGKFVDPHPACAPIAVQDLFLVWQDEAGRMGLESIAWESAADVEKINVDPNALAGVFRELLTNAKQFGKCAGWRVRVAVANRVATFELAEPKADAVDPSRWGNAPLISTRRGAYGLGLWEADRSVRANGGSVTRTVDTDGALITRLSFPIA